MVDINKLAVQDRVSKAYRESPKQPLDATAKRVVVENTAADPAIVALTSAPTSTNILNFATGLANNEVSQALTANVKQLLIRNKDNGKLQIAFTAAESGIKYFTIPTGTTLTLSNINESSTTLYLQSNKATQNIQVLEII